MCQLGGLGFELVSKGRLGGFGDAPGCVVSTVGWSWNRSRKYTDFTADDSRNEVDGSYPGVLTGSVNRIVGVEDGSIAMILGGQG